VETDPVAPAFEANWGAAPNLHLHIIRAFGAILPSNNPRYFPAGVGPSAYGLTDIELGAKYRFVKETKHRPEFGTFTMLEIPTGSYAKGLGVGKVWYKLPIWVQKSWGHWTTYGGAGYQIVPQTGYRNFTYGGWLLQRDIGKKLTLGAEDLLAWGGRALLQHRPGPPPWSTLAAITTSTIPACKSCLPTAILPSGKLRTTHISGCTTRGGRNQGKASMDSWHTIFPHFKMTIGSPAAR
jgi:hypothetical protein